jgi:hypothetical protein
MTQVLDVTHSGNVTVCLDPSTCLTFSLSDPALPADVASLISGILTNAGSGVWSVHLERRENFAFTFATLTNGSVTHSEGVASSFDQVMAAYGRLDTALNPEAPPSDPYIPNLSFSQLLIGLVTESWITEAEGEGWLVGILPDPVLAVIAMLPADHRFAAKARAIRPSMIVRADPLVGAMAAAEGKTAEEIDAFFVTYSTV